MRLTFSAVLVAVSMAVPAWNATLALYVFDGTDNVPVTTTLAGISASNLTQHGLTQAQVGAPLFFAASDWPVNAFGASYFELTLTPNPSTLVDFSTVTLDYTIGTNPVFNTELRSSVDGFTTSLATHLNPSGISVHSDALAALGVQSGPVTFRLYGFAVDDSFGSSGFYNSSLSFNTTADPIVIPEPASLTMIAVGSVVLLSGLSRKKMRSVR
jgi:hypothetical protein